MSFQWIVPPDVAWSGLAGRYQRAIERDIATIVRHRSKDVEAWMKSNAPWNDITGDARRTLHTEIETIAHESATIILAHGVPYGIWLEIANQGRFQIIGHALDVWGPIIWRDVEQLLGGQ